MKSARIIIKNNPISSPIFMTVGSIEKIGNSLNVRYEYDNSSYCIGVSDKIITVSRSGEEEYTMFLEQGKTKPFVLITNYGRIPLEVFAKKVEYTESDKQMIIDLEYDMISGKEKQEFQLYLICKYD